MSWLKILVLCVHRFWRFRSIEGREGKTSVNLVFVCGSRNGMSHNIDFLIVVAVRRSKWYFSQWTSILSISSIKSHTIRFQVWFSLSYKSRHNIKSTYTPGGLDVGLANPLASFPSCFNHEDWIANTIQIINHTSDRLERLERLGSNATSRCSCKQFLLIIHVLIVWYVRWPSHLHAHLQRIQTHGSHGSHG